MDDDFVKIAYADLAACVIGSLLWFSGSDGAHAVGQAILVFAGVIAVPALFIVLVDLGARLSMLWPRAARGPTDDASARESSSSGPGSPVGSGELRTSRRGATTRPRRPPRSPRS